MKDIRVLGTIGLSLLAVGAVGSSGELTLVLIAGAGCLLVALGVRLTSGSLLALGLLGIVGAWAIAAPGDVALGAGAVGMGVVAVALLAASAERRHVSVEAEVKLSRTVWTIFDTAVAALAVVFLGLFVGDSDRSLASAMIGVGALAGVVVLIYALGSHQPTSQPEASDP